MCIRDRDRTRNITSICKRRARRSHSWHRSTLPLSLPPSRATSRSAIRSYLKSFRRPNRNLRMPSEKRCRNTSAAAASSGSTPRRTRTFTISTSARLPILRQQHKVRRRSARIRALRPRTRPPPAACQRHASQTRYCTGCSTLTSWPRTPTVP